MALFENDYCTAMEMEDDAFAFMQFYCTKLYYSFVALTYN